MLAVTSAVRSTLLPDVPTIAEAALPGFEAVLLWPGRAAGHAAGGHRLAQCAALNSARSQERGGAGAARDRRRRAAALDPRAVRRRHRREETQWSKVVKASGAKAE